MLAIDTNVVVRLLVGDDPEQQARARDLIAAELVFVPVTVMLETEWVLRSVYGHAAAVIAKALRAFGGLPNVTIEDAGEVSQALAWAEAGLEFADALHLAKAAHCDGFASFDRRFARAADRLSPLKVRVL